MGLDSGGRHPVRVARGRAVTRSFVALLAAAALAAGSCGEHEETELVVPADTSAVSTPGAGEPAVPGAADTVLAAAADSAAWTAGIVDRERPIAGAATLVGVRAARHEDFDRIVFEFAEGRPGFHVEYVDRPVRDCGAGEVVPVAGDGWLLVRFTPANAHDEEGRATAGERRMSVGLPVVLEVVRICDFEAVVEYVLGVAAPHRYRVVELESPPRVVIDIRLHRLAEDGP